MGIVLSVPPTCSFPYPKYSSCTPFIPFACPPSLDRTPPASTSPSSTVAGQAADDDVKDADDAVDDRAEDGPDGVDDGH